MKSRLKSLLAVLTLPLLTPAYGGIDSVNTVNGEFPLTTRLVVGVEMEGPVGPNSTLRLLLNGADVYGNPITDFELDTSNVGPLLGPLPDQDPETESVDLVWTIPNDGTLHNPSGNYSFTVEFFDSNVGTAVTRNGGTFDIVADTNLIATSAVYTADTYEGGDLIEVTYTVVNTSASGFNLQTRPLRSVSGDSYRSRVVLSADPGYDAAEDFLLGFSQSLGDRGLAIPSQLDQVRVVNTIGTPPEITSFGRSYQPQPDNGFLDIGESITLTEEFIIPNNFTGTYFLVFATDTTENLAEQSETDNTFESDSTPRIRIISGPASSTKPVSEVTSEAGNQIAQADNRSDESSISEDGLIVAFQSFASNLTPDASFTYNGLSQIFVRNTGSNEITLVSESINSSVANGSSINAAISANGRYVAFESDASNIVNGDTNGFSDIFVRDIELGSTTRVSVNRNDFQANGASFSPSISETGRFIAFESVATNLDIDSSVQPGPETGRIQIYVADRDVSDSGFFDLPGNTAVYLVSFNNSGELANDNLLNPVLSLDGGSIAFVTDSTNFPGSNGHDQIYLRSLTNGQVTDSVSIVSRADGLGAVGDGDSGEPTLNGGINEPNGLQIAFSSQATNLISDDTNGVSDIFVRDFSDPSNITTSRISISNNRKAFTTLQFFNPFTLDGSPPNNNPLAGDFIILNDGTNPAVTFTFGTNVAIGSNAAVTRDNLLAAINATANLNITATASNPPSSPYFGPDVSSGYAPGLSLLNDIAGTAGNQLVTVSSAVIFVGSGGFVGGGTQGDNSLTPSVEQGVPTGSIQPSIDRSGSLIAFRSLEQNLTINNATGEWLRPLLNGYSNVFLRDRDVNGSGTFDTDGNTNTTKISVDRFGYPTNGLLNTDSSGSSRLPSISADGGTISLSTDSENNGGLRFGATNVIPLDTNGFRDIFIFQRDINRNPDTGTTLRPTVTLSSPATGDTITIGESTILEALVAPIGSNNPITVEFFVNGILIGEDSESPFVSNWIPESTGDFTLVARATETNVGSSVSDPVNVSVSTPSGAFVTITTPTEGNGFALGNAISITAEAGVVNTTGTVDNVVFEANGVVIATVTEAPYTTEFTPSSNGQITLRATATASVNGGTGNSTASDSISVTVATNPPTVSFTSPQNDVNIPLNQPVNISVAADSPNADVASVEFFVDGNSLGTDTTFPYSVTFTPTSLGELVIQAFVTDSEGIRSGDSISVEVINLTSTIQISEPIAGAIFSVYDPQTVTAIVDSQGRTVRNVDFFANGEIIGSASFFPFRTEFDPETSGDVILTATVTFTDGVQLTTAGIPVQVTSNPRLTSDDFVAQTLTDFFGVVPTDEEVQQLAEGVDNTNDSKVNFVADLTESSDFQAGISIVGAFVTQLYRFPTVTEYQTAITGLGFDTTGGGTTDPGDTEVGVPSQTSGSLDTFFETDTYTFTITTPQSVTIFTEGPTDTVGTLRGPTGAVVDIDDQAGVGNNFSITQFLTAGTYSIDVTGFFGQTGIYTLFVQGAGGAGSGGTTGTSNFDLEGLVAQLFDSTEYLDKFGQIPNLTGATNGSAGDLNRRALFSQLWTGKYGGLPNDDQELQASLRIVLLGGINPFTAILISEQQIVVEDLTTGQASDPEELIIDAASRRDYWRLAVLVTTLWNEQPTEELLAPLEPLSLNDQINVIINDPRYLERFPPPESLLFSAEIQPDGWMYSAWMDGWINQNSKPWYLHTELGWLYTEAITPDSVWYYSQGAGDWMWTNEFSFPWAYFVSREGGGWFYSFFDEEFNITWFVSDDGTGNTTSFAVPGL